MSGTLKGGLTPINGATVNLCEATNELVSLSCPVGGVSLGTAKTSSTGSFTISYTAPSTPTLLYLSAQGASPLLIGQLSSVAVSIGGGGANSYLSSFFAPAGLSGSLPATVTVNELTTVVGLEVFRDIPLANLANIFNNYYKPLMDVATGEPLLPYPVTSIGAQQTAFMSDYEVIVNAYASCVDSTLTCSAIATDVEGNNPAPTTIIGMAEDIDSFQYDSAYDGTMFSNLYNNYNAMALTTDCNLPVSPPGYISSFGFTYTVGSYPNGSVAIDSSGNVWTANGGNGTAGTAAGDSNVTELVAAGGYAASNTYVAGSYCEGVAVDSSGNFWVTDKGNGTAGTNVLAGTSNLT